MNKLFNLILIFLCLFLVPKLLKNTPTLQVNLIVTAVVGVIQFMYNYIMKVTKRKDITVKRNMMETLFKMIVVLSGMYLFDEMKQTNVLLQSNEIYKSIFIILILTFFILLKCLTIP